MGHDYPVFLKFKGKGNRYNCCSYDGIWLENWFMLFHYFCSCNSSNKICIISIHPLSAGIVVEVLIFHPGRWDLFAMCVLYAFFAIYRHRANIGRLLSGTESKIGQKVEVKNRICHRKDGSLCIVLWADFGCRTKLLFKVGVLWGSDGYVSPYRFHYETTQSPENPQIFPILF